MNLELDPEEEQALISLLRSTIDYARYPLSPRLYPLKAILAKLAPAPPREPLPPVKVYEPPRATSRQRRGRR